jgi:hypothetical protein
MSTSSLEEPDKPFRREESGEARMSELAQGQPDAGRSMPASIILQKLHDEAPADHFTLDWLMSNLHKQSFGLIMLVLAIVAVAPGVSVVGGLLLLIPAFQMIVGRSAPAFPRWIAARQLPTRRLGTVVQRAITTLGYLEKMVYPRWPTPPGTTRRVVGFIVMMLSARLILTPIPLSNILPALVIALISLAYAEEDGLILSICLLAGFVMIAIDLAIVWEIINGAKHSPFTI